MSRAEIQAKMNYVMTTLENYADGMSPPLSREQARSIADDIDETIDRLMREGLEG